MLRNLAIAAMLSVALAMPAQEAAAQDLGDVLFGGAVGAIFGGGRGAAIGGFLGATAGGVISAEVESRRHGYYYYDQGCYIRRHGEWVRVHRRHCY
jgi:uncharacterized protein YcfJ